MKIAIIGTGISGMAASYLLASNHDITVYEKNSRIGGHSRTIDIQVNGKIVPVDTGFIVFNDWNYPHLIELFRMLEVPYVKSDMSFGVSINDGWLEYASGDLFAQKKNISRFSYWGMIFDILRFNKQALSYVREDVNISLGECLDRLRMGKWFREYYILAMGAAIWSCPVETMMKFPAKTFLQFFKNHGLLNITQRPQWYTVSGGSREYIRRLIESFKDRIKLNCAVLSVTHQNGELYINDVNGQTEKYDKVVFACHADEALKMIENPPNNLSSILGAFSYQENKVVVHSDRNFMPVNEKCWASWVYLSEKKTDDKAVVSLSYWMNNLQNLKTEKPVIITLNPQKRPKEDLIHDEYSFSHPVFDIDAVTAQDKIRNIQDTNGMWFCGAYQRYGFHEDGLMSAMHVAKGLGAEIPWQ